MACCSLYTCEKTYSVYVSGILIEQMAATGKG